MKFDNIKLILPDINKAKRTFAKYTENLENVETVEEALEIINKVFKYQDRIETEMQVIAIRYSINTRNFEYSNAAEKADELSPQFSDLFTKFNTAVLHSKFRPELENALGKHLFKIYENDELCYNPIILDDLIEENKLINKYDSLVASAEIPYNDGIYNLTQIAKYMSSPDRNTRIEAAHKYWGFFEKNDDLFGDIYDKLVKVRTSMAHKLGYKNFVELGYKRLGRLDYNAEMVKGYRKQIEETVVPQVKKLVERQTKRIGIENPLFVDLNLQFLSGNATPKGKINDLVKAAGKMYNEMSPETGKFFKFMKENNLMDLNAKPGKMSGGYMTYLPLYKSPFIFSNSNGTSGDVDTLTHEFGHAFQGHLGSKINIPNYRMPTLEACEIDSMSMEFFAYPWMELFFGDEAEKYKFSHLSGAIEFLPYGVAVDEFQHFVYENPEVSHKERCKKWREIDRKYRPWINYEGFDYLENGAFWLKQSHIFDVPFYYIDYTLAQVLALQFKCEMDVDRNSAWKKYIHLCEMGGKYPFIELIEKAGLRNPFVDGNVAKVVEPQMKILDSIDDTKF